MIFPVSDAKLVFVSAFADTFVQPFVQNGTRDTLDCSGATEPLTELARGGVPQKLHW